MRTVVFLRAFLLIVIGSALLPDWTITHQPILLAFSLVAYGFAWLDVQADKT